MKASENKPAIGNDQACRQAQITLIGYFKALLINLRE